MPTYAGFQLDVKVGATLASVTGSGTSAGSIEGITKIDYDYDNKLESHESTGQRTIYALTEGIIEITGTIERSWTGSGTDTWTRGTNETGSLTSRYIGIYPNGAVSGQPYIALSEVKFGKTSKSHKPGSVLMSDTLTFIGTREYTGSVP
jgi:hypothetical protein